jgi:hypothetical protein
METNYMNDDNNPCTRDCSFQLYGNAMSCFSGDPTCDMVNILEAEESDFHDLSLIKATSAIKGIIANIPPDPNGRNLSFIHTNMGTLLAWVEHGETAIEGAVTADDDDATITAALKLIL